jgi:hypothetical protein
MELRKSGVFEYLCLNPFNEFMSAIFLSSAVSFLL